jgi:2-polyprenyl-3-methyl-5-hydroxy-6-metoxy-1,4-benzoquinol methylase
MPTSDPTGLLPVIHDVMRMRPLSILDVGVGMGKWGLLFREYLEGWGHHRYSRDQWKLRIDGIEIYEPYIQPWHREIYDRLYIGDIRTQQLPKYDLIYMGDVIEHMTKPEGHALLRSLAARHIIVSTPNVKTQMKRGKPNPHQDHKCRWTLADFRAYRHTVLRGAKNERLLVVRIDK